MERETMAIVISSCSAAIAFFALGWNVFRDIIAKPKIKVKFGKKVLVDAKFPESHSSLIEISGTNFGPGNVTCTTVCAKKSSLYLRLLRKEECYFVIVDFDAPFGDRLPKKIEPGDRVSLHMEYEKEVLNTDFTDIGIGDSFGRVHWAKKQDVIRFLAQRAEDFK